MKSATKITTSFGKRRTKTTHRNDLQKRHRNDIATQMTFSVLFWAFVAFSKIANYVFERPTYHFGWLALALNLYP